MELGADNGTLNSALLGHATVVILLSSADGASAGAAGTTSMVLLVLSVLLVRFALCAMVDARTREADSIFRSSEVSREA